MTSEHISETVFCEPFNCSHCDKKFAEKPTARISLAQKLDIIEASKKSGFSIEDVMKKDLDNLCGFFHALSVCFLNQNYCHILNI